MQKNPIFSVFSLKPHDHHFNLLNYYVWPRITDEVSLPEMGIWSILLIKSDLKWCIHLSRSLFLYVTTRTVGSYMSIIWLNLRHEASMFGYKWLSDMI